MAASPTSLLYERLEAPLAPLDRLPRGLWLWGLVHSQGRLELTLRLHAEVYRLMTGQ
ncbi:MAG: hypothetical protein ABI409_05250 [Ramlibacter sp.]